MAVSMQVKAFHILARLEKIDSNEEASLHEGQEGGPPGQNTARQVTLGGEHKLHSQPSFHLETTV